MPYEFARASFFNYVAQYAESAIERKPCAQQRRKLSRQQDDRARRETPRPQKLAARCKSYGAAASDLVRANWDVALAAQLLDDGCTSGCLKLTLEQLARRSYSLILESRHREVPSRIAICRG
jgi:hypothetical protein